MSTGTTPWVIQFYTIIEFSFCDIDNRDGFSTVLRLRFPQFCQKNISKTYTYDYSMLYLQRYPSNRILLQIATNFKISENGATKRYKIPGNAVVRYGERNIV